MKGELIIMEKHMEKLIKNNETVNNYEIPIRIAYILGFTEEDFPVSKLVA